MSEESRPVVVPVANDALECGPLWLSPGEMCELRVRGRRVPMSVRQIAMVAVLLQANGKVISAQELYERSSGEPMPTKSRTVAVHVARIRRALGALGAFLIAVPERGYRIDVVGLAQVR